MSMITSSGTPTGATPSPEPLVLQAAEAPATHDSVRVPRPRRSVVGAVRRLPRLLALTAQDAGRRVRTGHRWPAPDEPSRERRRAQLARLCGDDASARPSVLVVVAHADDEVLWAGSRLLAMHDTVSLVYVTDGAPREADLRYTGCTTREEYAVLRRNERDRALAIAGIAPRQVHDFEFADQESRLQLGRLTRRVGALIDRIDPEIVLTHPYESGHPDHDAVAFAVHMAVRLRRQARKRTPAIMEFAAYHRRFGRARSHHFLPAHDCDARTVVLDATMRDRKAAMYACFPSQFGALAHFPLEIERYRCAPRYDFHQPANWERVLFSVQPLPGEPNRTLPTALVVAAEAELQWHDDSPAAMADPGVRTLTTAGITPAASVSTAPVLPDPFAPPRARVASLQGHIPVLDGIRGLAILMVMLLHFIGHMVPTNRFEGAIVDVLDFGRLGVALFFVLSGFLITGILLDAKGASGYFRNFYVRRALRIFPLYYAVLILVFLVAPMIPALRGADLATVRANQAWAWLYGTNILLAVRGAFVMPYMNHFWSLAVEEHFYFVWPLIVWACSRERLVKLSLAMAGASMLLSASAAAAGASEMALYVFTPFRMDGLCLGAFLAAWGRGEEGVAALRRVIAPITIGAACTIVVTLAIGRVVPVLRVPFHEVRQTMIDALFAVLIARTLTAPDHAISARFFGARVLCWLGVYSYGLYVFHHFISFYFVQHRTEFALAGVVGSHFLAVLLQAVVGGGVSVVIAVLSYRYFESPFLALKKRWAPSPARGVPVHRLPLAGRVLITNTPASRARVTAPALLARDAE